MTTIAFRAGVLACDSAVTYSERTVICRKVKIIRGPEGQLAGGCGELGVIQDFLNWVANGCQGDGLAEETDGIVVWPDGRIYVTAGTQKLVQVEADYIAIGHGHQAAMGAMWAGATAPRAIYAACELTEASRPPVHTLSFVS